MSKKKKSLKRARIKASMILIFLLLIFSVVLIFFLNNNFFNIDKIQVKGNKQISSDKIMKISGCMLHENIFKIRIKDMEKKLINYPYIKYAHIDRKIPNKVIIQVTERMKDIIIPYVGSYIYLDKEGYVLDIMSEKKKDKLIEIIGLKIDQPRVGEKLVITDKETGNDVTNFIQLCNKINMFKLFSKIDFTNNDNIYIYMNNGTKVDFGGLNNVKYKLSFLDKILKDLDKKNICCKYIYLNKGKNPIVVKGKK